MHIPTWPQSGEREAELLQMVLQSPQWGGFHPFISEFERSFASYQQARHGIAMFNGTVTLELCLELLSIAHGAEVIVPAISFISSATAVSRAGAVPVFVDIGLDTYNLDYERVREAITPQTKAVMAVHFAGTMCDMDQLHQICRDHKLILVEDAAHAHGSEWCGQRAGSFGVAGSFSFQNGKVLCSGEGGMLVTSDETLAEAARSVVNCGRTTGKSFYLHSRLGTNYRLGAFQAAVLLAQFERLPEQIAHRARNAQILRGSVDPDEIIWQEQPSQVTGNSWYLALGRISKREVDRDEFVRRLVEAGIPATPFYPHTLFQNPVYIKEQCRIMDCPNAERAVRESFWFPHRVLLSDEGTIQRIGEEIRNALVAASSAATFSSRS